MYTDRREKKLILRETQNTWRGRCILNWEYIAHELSNNMISSVWWQSTGCCENRQVLVTAAGNVGSANQIASSHIMAQLITSSLESDGEDVATLRNSESKKWAEQYPEQLQSWDTVLRCVEETLASSSRRFGPLELSLTLHSSADHLITPENRLPLPLPLPSSASIASPQRESNSDRRAYR